MSEKQYPPLPEPGYFDSDAFENLYTEEQMRAYVDADRAQRLPLEEEAIEKATGAKRGTPTFLVALAFCRAIEATHGIHEPKESGNV